MKHLKLILALALPVVLYSCKKDGLTHNEFPTDLENGRAVTGNGAPSGAHYNLNIIGVPKGKSADMTGNNGGRLFVNLVGATKIMLTPAPVGQSFQVLDANGTDGNASFQLPKDVTANYRVFARVPGNSGGSAKITTCAEYTWDGTEIPISLCSSVTMSRLNYSKFTDVSTELLNVTLSADILDANGNTVVKAGRYPLFDEALQGYFWQYDNSGLKILQLRFYEN